MYHDVNMPFNKLVRLSASIAKCLIYAVQLIFMLLTLDTLTRSRGTGQLYAGTFYYIYDVGFVLKCKI